MSILVGAVVIFFVFAFNFTVYSEILPECEAVESKTFVADSNDCESYIYCDEEESFVSKCPTNQRFNTEIGICDDPENVVCLLEGSSTSPQTTLRTSTRLLSTEKKQTTTAIVSSTEPSSSTSATSRSSSSSTKSNPTTSSTIASSSSTVNLISSKKPLKGQIICPTPLKLEEIIYLPNSESCSKYFMCFNSTPIPMTCPKDLEFNTSTSSCDWASLSNCKIAGTTTKSPRELCTGLTSGYYFEYSKNCHYYYRCMSGMLTIQECPSGFGWDAKNKMCTSTACRRRN